MTTSDLIKRLRLPAASLSLCSHCQGINKEQRTTTHSCPVLCPGNGAGTALRSLSSGALSSVPAQALYHFARLDRLVIAGDEC
jgi:hypothetical protein